MMLLPLLAVLAMVACPSVATAAPEAERTVVRLVVDGPISPASAAYIERGIAHANEVSAEAVVLQLDTPGGLASSMRDIIKVILASRVPVVGYVAPAGARAASAGTYILYACHVAAMAPTTHLGAATPVALLGKPSAPPADDSGEQPAPGAERQKVINDAVAYIRSLADKRGRNADWAEQAVREADTLEATAALDQQVIDLIAPDTNALLEAIDGRKLTVAGHELVLHTAGATVQTRGPDWRSRFLGVIANPSVAYLLLLIGMFGLLLEGYHPGAIVPGVVGAICLLLALYAFQLLPVNFAGLALMLLGMALMVAEMFVPSFGTLGMGGVVSFVVGSVVLMDTDIPGYGLPLPLVAAIALVAALAVLGIGWMALRSLRRPQVSGAEEMVGLDGTVLVDFDAAGHGRVLVHGESWQARADHALSQGDAVRVVAMQGLVLEVVALAATDIDALGER